MPRTGRPKVEMARVSCVACSKELLRYPCLVRNSRSGRYFCSKECQHLVGSKPRRKAEVTCEWCAKVFYPQSGHLNRFCGKACHDGWQGRNAVVKQCETCSGDFVLRPSLATKNAGRFCSRKCMGEAGWRRPAGREHNGKPALYTPGGYVKVWERDHPNATPSGWVLEHRMVVSDIIGRKLARSEHVHHRNGVKDDNRPENLELMSASDHSSKTGYDRALREREEREQVQQELAEYRRRFGALT